jgi:hypothetical protein
MEALLESTVCRPAAVLYPAVYGATLAVSLYRRLRRPLC